MAKSLRTRLFQMWFRLSRPMTLGVRGLVEDADGRVLLVRHTYVKGLHLPGGGVERGEPVETSLRRELEEEGGVYMRGPGELLGVYSNHGTFKNDHVVFYRVTAFELGEAKSAGEIAERIWTRPCEAPADTTPATRRRLNEVYGGAAAELYW